MRGAFLFCGAGRPASSFAFGFCAASSVRPAPPRSAAASLPAPPRPPLGARAAAHPAPRPLLLDAAVHRTLAAPDRGNMRAGSDAVARLQTHMPPPWLQRGGFKLLPVAAFLKICGQAEHDTATQLGESLVAMLRNPRDWLRDITYSEDGQGLALTYLEEQGSRFARFVEDYESEAYELLETPALLDAFVEQMTQIYVHILKVYRNASDIVYEVDTRFVRALHAEAAHILDYYADHFFYDDYDADSLLFLINRDFPFSDTADEPSFVLLMHMAMARPLESCVCRYNLATLWQGWLAYIRCKDPLLRWLERAQHRMGAYEEGGVARLRDLEAYRADVMDEA